MHLSGGNSNSSLTGGQIHPAAAQVLASRKRKFLDQGGGAHLGSGNGSGKLFGAMRPPSHRGNSDEEAPLHTPQCSQSGKFFMTLLTVWLTQADAFHLVSESNLLIIKKPWDGNSKVRTR
jgi:hypothetical protein